MLDPANRAVLEEWTRQYRVPLDLAESLLRLPTVIDGTTFCGAAMAQVWGDLLLWERVFNAHPELRCLIELGTGGGGFSHFLQAQCLARGMSFATFDWAVPPSTVPGWHKADVLQDIEKVVRHFRHPMLLSCDNGNKPLEVATYLPHLVPGDLVAVHDWGTEIYSKDIPDVLVPIHDDWSFGMTRMFQVPS